MQHRRVETQSPAWADRVIRHAHTPISGSSDSITEEGGEEEGGDQEHVEYKWWSLSLPPSPRAHRLNSTCTTQPMTVT